MAGAARLTFGFALALAALLLPGAASAADLLLGPESGFTIPVELGGATLRLRVDPAASGLVILNPDAVARARLTPEMMRGRPGIPGQYIRPSYARIGPVALAGRTRAVTARLAGQALRIQAIWFDRAVIDGADGLISPALLPYDSITFRLGADMSVRLPSGPGYAEQVEKEHRWLPGFAGDGLAQRHPASLPQPAPK